MTPWLARTAALLVITCLLPDPSTAQVRRSERGSVSQTVSGTVITVEYSRPVARGRTLFGGVVRWGEHWTPGADWATTIEVSRDVEIEGQPVPDGKYSLWMIPAETGAWTVYLSNRERVFHTQRQHPEHAAVRFTVEPAHAEPLDVLTFSFPSVNATGTRLQFQWGSTVIPMEITVQPGGR